MGSESAKIGGISFCGLLTILLIALKLTNVIAISWGWVLAPLWVPIVIALIAIIIIIFVGIIKSV